MPKKKTTSLSLYHCRACGRKLTYKIFEGSNGLCSFCEERERQFERALKKQKNFPKIKQDLTVEQALRMLKEREELKKHAD